MRLSFETRDEDRDYWITREQAKFIMNSVAREVMDSRTPWDEIKDKTLADLVSENQDALVDDVADAAVCTKVADSLLPYHRAKEIRDMFGAL